MNLQQLQHHLNQLIGCIVTHKSIAGNSMELSLARNDIDSAGFTLWLDPPWRLESASGIIASSADFPWEPEEDETREAYRRRFLDACARSDGLEGAIVDAVAIDPISTDLSLQFGNGLRLRLFSVEREAMNWCFSDLSEMKRYEVSPEVIRIEMLPS